jgi:4-aminobutyrate aminotransferase
VVQAIQERASQLIFGQMNIVMPPATLHLAEELNAVTPASIHQFFFSNSGAEAVEAAVKLARMATKRRNIIVFQGSFHGRTHQAMAMTTSKYVYRYNYQPLPGAIFVAPFPYAYYYGWDEATTEFLPASSSTCCSRARVRRTRRRPSSSSRCWARAATCPRPPSFLRRLRALCDEHGILLVLDEVQSGFGPHRQVFLLRTRRRRRPTSW